MTRSLRRALAVRFAVTMAVGLAAVSAVICWGATAVLERQLDQALAAEAFFTGEILRRTDRAGEALLVPRDEARYGRDINRYVVLRTPAGRVVAALPANAADLPLDSVALTGALDGERQWRSTAWHGMAIRTLYTRLNGIEREAQAVQVAASLDPIRALRRRLILALAAVVLLGTLATFAGAWALARRVVLPVAEITEQAQRIEAGTLDQRIVAHAEIQEYQGLVGVLNRMLGRLETAFRTQRRLTTDVSHELRSPLTALHGQIEVALRNERSPDEYRRVLRSSLEEIDRMIELTEELLLLTRAEARLVQARRQETELKELIRAALDRLRPRLDEKAVVVEESLAAPVAAVDAGLFAALLARLLDNAVKFAPAGGRVRVATERCDGGVRLAVEDSGPGIAVEDLPHLFDPFFRADQARTSGSGTGLGLALVAAVTRLHGGTVEASNLPGGGARFQVDIPDPSRG